ncbi:MAG: SpoIID/LytB domain-containing protein [Bacteroidales bacterium]|nr:SpoIID/LytB domain-containing protein [Bacteroidales bacterium]
METPQISVGVLASESVKFSFTEKYLCRQTNKTVEGEGEVMTDGLQILYNGVPFDRLDFEPVDDNGRFELYNVRIGIGFHWERLETQLFSGELHFVVEDNKIRAINRLPIEDYLFCVIASEMSATSSAQLLRAHAVTSRSWLMAQLDKSKRLQGKRYKSTTLSESMLIRWYDREDHKLFDVCADDHCQRYQGLTRASNSAVRDAIDATRGQVITFGGEICDARFSKCCGGVTELFETCWEPVQHPYLQSFVDDARQPDGFDTDLTKEDNARRWIENAPSAFCNTNDATILRQVLNSYDQETADFYRWRVEYTAEQLTDIVRRKTGIDFGLITSLEPIERGPSGRIVKLRITGTKCNFVIGKELEVRRALSESHLYSSAFTVEKNADRFILRGAGWGHGVGLCQIGAAVMSYSGYDYKMILNHYFRNAKIEKLW